MGSRERRVEARSWERLQSRCSYIKFQVRSRSPLLVLAATMNLHDRPSMANFLHVVAVKSYRHRVCASPESESLSGGYVVIKNIAYALTLLLALSPLSPSSVWAQTQSIFKCVGRDNHVAFQDKPCASGLGEQHVTIAPAPPPASSPDYSRSSPHDAFHKQRSMGSPRQKIVYSFECRTKSGALFYRHSGCPGSIDLSGLIGGGRHAQPERVSRRRITRLDACRGMRSAGRDGREFDEVPSTYERNLGRDPCRFY